MRLTLVLSILFLSLTAQASIRSYFNNRDTASYQDPFRGINRKGDNLEKVIIEEIDKAKKSIFVAVQEIRLPAIAKKLVEKQAQGLDVRVVLENSYNHNILAQPNRNGSEDSDPNSHESTRYRDLILLIDQDRDGKITRNEMLERDAVFILQQARIPLVDDTEDGSAGSGLMHHKFVVIDENVTILSSANFTPSCIHGDVGVSSSRGNDNALMVIKSKPLNRLFAEEFDLLWTARFGIQKPFRGARTVTVAGKKLTVQFSPSTRKVEWEMTTNGLISKQIKTARVSVQAGLFVFSDQKIADAMKEVSPKASISVLVESKFAFRFFSQVLDLLGVVIPNPSCVIPPDNNPWSPAVQTAGSVRNKAGDVLHHKFGVVDKKKTIFGSHNWSEAANSINDEFLVVVDDAETASEFSTEFNRLTRSAEWGIPYRVTQEVQRMREFCQL